MAEPPRRQRPPVEPKMGPVLLLGNMSMQSLDKIGPNHDLALYEVVGHNDSARLLACQSCGSYLQRRIGSLALPCQD
eukprot:5202586-Prorocentrum_lima.AAC.1